MAENAFTALLQKVASGATPWKDSVRTVATTNHALTGLQTISGVLVEEGDPVLETGRTNPAENGKYKASAGAWVRAEDMASATYAKLGTTVLIREGDYGGQTWKLSSPTNGEVRVGVTPLVFELGIASPVLASPSGAAQTLPDANTMITSARRAIRTAALTANRADTLPDGTTVGERRTLERLDATATYRNRVMNSDGSVAAWLNRQGQVEIAWDGSRWAPVGADLRDQTITPYDFGGRPEPGFDNSEALQDMFDAASLIQKHHVMLIPLGIWEFATPLVLRGGGDNYGSFLLRGQGGRSYGFTDSVLKYTGAATVEAALTTYGVSGSQFEDFSIDANLLAKFGLLLSIDDTDESSAGIELRRMSIVQARNVTGACQLRVGPLAPTTSGATQVSEVTIDDCRFLGDITYALSSYEATGIYLGSDNAKNFSIKRCHLVGNRRQIWNTSNSPVEIDHCTFDGTQGVGTGAELYNAGGAASLRNCHTERGRCFVDAPGNAQRVTVSDCQWNGYTDDKDFVMYSAGELQIEGSRFYNDSVNGTVQSVSGDTFTVRVTTESGSFVHNFAANRRVVLTSTSTTGLPLPLEDGRYYFVRDVVSVGSGVGYEDFTCKLSETSGGAVKSLTSTGSGILRMMAPAFVGSMVGVSSAQAQLGGGATISQSHFQGVGFSGPLVNGTRSTVVTDHGSDTLDPYLISIQSLGVRSVITGSVGGDVRFGAGRTLRDLSGEPLGQSRLSCNTLGVQYGLPYLPRKCFSEVGRQGSTITKVRIDWDDLRRMGTTSIQTFINSQNRTMLRSILCDVRTAFAGVATMTCAVQENHGGLYLLGAAGLDMKTAGLYRTPGSAFASGDYVASQGWCPAAQWAGGFTISLIFTLATSATNLTNGVVHFDIETCTYDVA